MSLKEFLQKSIPARYIMAFMSFLLFVFNYVLRLNINITIVAMVNYSAIARANDSGRGSQCGFEYTADPYDPKDDGPFAWNENTQSTIISSFFWGYVITQIPGGRLCETLSSKWVLGLSIVLSGVLNLIFPLFAQQNPLYLIVVRVLMGLCQGPTFPGMHAMMARWVPAEERSRMAAFIYAGSQVGTLIVYPLASYITNKLGWEYVFYLMGGSSFVWGAFWFYLIYDSPAEHPRIDPGELEYLNNKIVTTEKRISNIPWKSVLTSMPFWAILVANVGNNWGWWMLLIELPIYMKHILNYDLQKSGFLSSMPYFFMWTFGIFYGCIADVALRRNWLKVKTIRKIAMINSHFCGALALIAVTFTGCNDVLTLILLNVAVGLQGAAYTGFLPNHIDIAPNFAATLYGITNCAGTISSILVPLTAGALTNGQQTLANWRKLFYISAAFYAGGSIFFSVFAEGEVQKWNKDETQAEDNNLQTKRERSAVYYRKS